MSTKRVLSVGAVALAITSLLSFSPAMATDTSTAVATSAPLSCAKGGACNVGDIGPGGGMVFYVRSEESVRLWNTSPNAEPDLTYDEAGWKYLEVAPKNWYQSKPDPELVWCANSNVHQSWVNQLQGRNYYYKWVPGTTQSGYLAGTGSANTKIIAKNCKSGAATAATNYRGGGLKGWYLPRQTEFIQLAFFAGGIPDPACVSGSGCGPTEQDSKFAKSKYALNWGKAYWLSSFTFGGTNQWQAEDRMGLGTNTPPNSSPYVRPIRAF